MSADVVESTVQEVLEEVVTALGLKGEVEVDRDGDVVTGTVHGHDLGLFIGRHGQTIDAVQHLVFRIVLTRGGGSPAATCAWSSTPRAIARAARRRCSARPTRPPRTRVARARPVALDVDDGERAQARARVPARPRRRRDVQRGRGARPPPRRRPAGHVATARFHVERRPADREPAAEVSRLTVAADVAAPSGPVGARYGLPAAAEARLAALLRPRRGRACGHHHRPRPAEGVDVARGRLARGPRPAGGARGPPRSPTSALAAGFPGLALAIALPDARVALVESVGRKCAFLGRGGRELGLAQRRGRQRARRGVAGRDRRPRPRRGPRPGAAARARRVRGAAARGRRGARGLEGAPRARPRRPTARPPRRRSGMSAPRRSPVEPFAGARDRHLYLSSKVESNAGALPAAPGNGPQTADPSLELKVMALRRRTNGARLRPARR